jgi:hypothetical protein
VSISAAAVRRYQACARTNCRIAEQASGDVHYDQEIEMKTFFVLFEIPAATDEAWRKETDPEKKKAAGDEMMAARSKWMQEHRGAFVETGAPLGKTKVVTASGVGDARNDLNYYAIVQAESHEAAASLFADHPHLQIPTSRIEVMPISQGPM